MKLVEVDLEKRIEELKPLLLVMLPPQGQYPFIMQRQASSFLKRYASW